MFCMATKELGKLTCQYLSKGFTLDKVPLERLLEFPEGLVDDPQRSLWTPAVRSELTALGVWLGIPFCTVLKMS